jgi:farnesyl diphosphate synthase
MNLTLNSFIADRQQRVEKCLSFYLQHKSSPAPALEEAMAYAVLNGGKRIRPLFIYATGFALNAPVENLDIAACASELIHAYSLIHDDLPAMDNSDLRRGIPTCHKAFGEALAILAGDALQPLAFEIIATHPAPLNAEQRLTMIQILSAASGAEGMAGGQVLDISGSDSLEKIALMYELKTGALISASVKLAIVAANVHDQMVFSTLEKFAKNISLAFQLQDDLLDIESATNTLGKPQGLDAVNNKKTYVVLAGVAETRLKIETLFAEALDLIKFLGGKARYLEELVCYLRKRNK